MAVQTQIQVRRGTAATWTSTNPTLTAGEVGLETDTGKFKIGNGSTAWASLAYALNGAIPQSIIDAKGDIVVGTAADTASVITAGANGLYLSADSTTTSGLKWTTAISSVTGAFGAVVESGSAGGTYTVTNNFPSGVYTIDISSNITTFTVAGITEISSGIYYTSTTATSATFFAQGPWTEQTSNFGGSAIRALTFGNNTYVSGGDSGKLATSTDGITWTTRTSGFGVSVINALTSDNNIYIAGGGVGKLTTSTNGITWTERTSNFGSSAITALTFGNNTYIAGGSVAALATSTDGITWTTRTSGFDASAIRALTFGNNTYVAAGDSGKLTTSTDGITWTVRTSPASTIRALTFGNDTYVSGGDSGNLRTTTNVAGTLDSNAFIQWNPSTALTAV